MDTACFKALVEDHTFKTRSRASIFIYVIVVRLNSNKQKNSDAIENKYVNISKCLGKIIG